MIIAPDPRLGLRALTVRQPYASRIENGTKAVEFRSWSPTYRGDLLITVSAAPRMPGLPVACTLCVVDLWDVEGEPGGWEWLLRNPRPVARLPVAGKLKLWAPDPALVHALALECTGRWTRP